MDPGVIRSLKTKYRPLFFRSIIAALDNNKVIPKIHILEAMYILTGAWDQVSTTTIVNRFKKGKISVTSQIEAINDFDEPFSDLKHQLDKLTRRDSFLLQVNSAENFVDLDNIVQSSNGVMTKEEILKQVISDDFDDNINENKDKEDLEIVDESFQCPIGSMLMSTLEALSIFGMLNGASVGDGVMALASKIGIY